MNFSSDNWAGAAPQIIDALAEEAKRYGGAYATSDTDARVEKRFCEIFDRDVAVFLVGTGTAANGLALAAVSRPGGIDGRQVRSLLYVKMTIRESTTPPDLLPSISPPGRIVSASRSHGTRFGDLRHHRVILK